MIRCSLSKKICFIRTLSPTVSTKCLRVSRQPSTIRQIFNATCHSQCIFRPWFCNPVTSQLLATSHRSSSSNAQHIFFLKPTFSDDMTKTPSSVARNMAAECTLTCAKAPSRLHVLTRFHHLSSRIISHHPRHAPHIGNLIPHSSSSSIQVSPSRQSKATSFSSESRRLRARSEARFAWDRERGIGSEMVCEI